MAGQVNIGGNTASVQLTGNDAITADQEIGFPNTNGDSAVVIVTPTSQDIETTGDIDCGSITATGSAEFARSLYAQNESPYGQFQVTEAGGRGLVVAAVYDKDGAKIVLNSDGNADFGGSITAAGAIEVGDDPRTKDQPGTRLGTTTGLTARGDTSTQYVLSLYDKGSDSRTVGIQATGLINVEGPEYNPITHRTSREFGQAFRAFGTSPTNGEDSAWAGTFNGTPTSRIDYDGIFYGTNTAVQPISSERRLKENIVAIDANDAWQTIKNTPFYSYNFIGSKAISYGAMADEVPAEMIVQPMEVVVIEEAVEPVIGPKGKILKEGKEAVIETKPRSDEEGPIRSYDNGMLQARLYTALQSALTRIEALEAQLTELKGGSN